MNTITTKKITYTGVMTALVFIGTFIIGFPISFTNGYIHFGDGFVFLSGIILGPIYGALAAGIGSALADITAGYAAWAGPTLIIKALMAFSIGLIAKRITSLKLNILFGSIFSAIWIGFSLFLRMILLGNITPSSDNLVSTVDGVDTVNELLELSQVVSTILLISAIIVPILVFIGLFLSKKITSNKPLPLYIIGYIISGLLMVILYYFTGYIMFGNYIAPIFSIPLNILQFTIGIGLSSLILPVTKLISFD